MHNRPHQLLRRAGIILTLSGLALGPIAAAPVPTDQQGPTLHPASSVAEVNGPRSVAIGDGVAYVAHRSGFSTIDLSDPTNPEVTDRQLGFDVLLPDESIEAVGDLLMVQVTDPTDPCPTGFLFTSCEIRLYDLTDPLHPQERGRLHHPAHNATCIHGCRYIYTTNGAIIDATDPTKMVVARTGVDVLTRLHDVTAVGTDRAYTIGAGVPVVEYLDVADPLDPQVVASHEPRTHEERGASPNKLRPLTGSDLAVASDSSFGATDCSDSVGLRLLDVSELHRWELDGVGTPAITQLDYITWGDGDAPARRDIDCSMSIDAHPAFGLDGGLAAVSNTQHGVGLLDLSADGSIMWLQRGVVTASAGQLADIDGRTSVTVRWLDDDHLLSVDTERGLEILRLERCHTRGTVEAPLVHPTWPGGPTMLHTRSDDVAGCGRM